MFYLLERQNAAACSLHYRAYWRPNWAIAKSDPESPLNRSKRCNSKQSEIKEYTDNIINDTVTENRIYLYCDGITRKRSGDKIIFIWMQILLFALISCEICLAKLISVLHPIKMYVYTVAKTFVYRVFLYESATGL